MSKKDKLIRRLEDRPKDFTYNELKVLLNYLGFNENNKGKTSGSRIEYINSKDNIKINFHKPHPNNIIKSYVIDEILKILKETEVI